MEKIASRCTDYIDKYGTRTEIELKKIKYGIEVILINLTKFIIIMSISYFLRRVWSTLIVMTSFGLVRKSAFGLHSKNSRICTVLSTVLFIGGSYLGEYYHLEPIAIILIFLILIYLFIRYAPADTEKRPLVGRKLRRKLKKNTIITVILLFITSFIVKNKNLRMLITIGVTIECVFILPITYKIFNRGYRNYEQYEKRDYI